MDINIFLSTLVSTENPVLPQPAVMRVALYGVWAIVLGAGAALLGRKLARPYRAGLVLLVMAGTLVPSLASPAYWLGLAFNIPSVMSGVLCLGWLLTRAWTEPALRATTAVPPLQALQTLSLVGVVLGWVLMLDTFALLPVSVYAWGFSSAAVGAVAVFATLLWAVQARATVPDTHQRSSGLLAFTLTLSVLALFVLTRLPTGNVWDALIDPWLWGALQAGWLLSVVRRLRRATYPPATTLA